MRTQTAGHLALWPARSHAKAMESLAVHSEPTYTTYHVVASSETMSLLTCERPFRNEGLVYGYTLEQLREFENFVFLERRKPFVDRLGAFHSPPNDTFPFRPLAHGGRHNLHLHEPFIFLLLFSQLPVHLVFPVLSFRSSDHFLILVPSVVVDLLLTESRNAGNTQLVRQARAGREVKAGENIVERESGKRRDNAVFLLPQLRQSQNKGHEASNSANYLGHRGLWLRL